MRSGFRHADLVGRTNDRPGKSREAVLLTRRDNGTDETLFSSEVSVRKAKY